MAAVKFSTIIAHNLEKNFLHFILIYLLHVRSVCVAGCMLQPIYAGQKTI